MSLDPKTLPPNLAAVVGITVRAQRSLRLLTKPGKMTFADLKAGKLATHVETADQFAGDLIAAARKLGTDRDRRGADILGEWDGEAGTQSGRPLLFYPFLELGGANFQSTGGDPLAPEQTEALYQHTRIS